MLTTVAVAAAAALPGLAGVAHALVPPAGPRCSLVDGPDATSEAGHFLGTLAGGPLAAAGATMTLTCSVQVGGSGVHTDPDAALANAGPAASTVTLPPTLVTYVGGVPTYVCTKVHEVDSAGTYDLYWDEVSQAWSQNAATSFCLAVPQPAAPVNGGVVVHVIAAATTPTVTLFGVLANPLLWTCAVPAYSPLVPWTVSCTPVSSSVAWTCATVATYSATASPGATVRTSLDCDGSAPPESQTAAVSGVAGFDADWANTTVAATTFACTFDNGSTGGPVADFTAFCADPGAAYAR